MNKVCTGCGIEKPLSDFYPRYAPGRGNIGKTKCKACVREIGIRYRARKAREHPSP